MLISLFRKERETTQPERALYLGSFMQAKLFTSAQDPGNTELIWGPWADQTLTVFFKDCNQGQY